MIDTKNPDAGRQELLNFVNRMEAFAYSALHNNHPYHVGDDMMKEWKCCAPGLREALAQSQPPDGWLSGKLFEDILRRRLGTASANDQIVETQHIIYGTELCTLASILDQLSSVKEECLLTIDRMNAEKAKPPEQGQVESPDDKSNLERQFIILLGLDHDYQEWLAGGKLPLGTEVIDGLDEAISFFDAQAKLWNLHIKPLIKAARRYSELARGKGGR